MKKFLLGGTFAALLLYSVGSTIAINELFNFAMAMEKRARMNMK